MTVKVYLDAARGRDERAANVLIETGLFELDGETSFWATYAEENGEVTYWPDGSREPRYSPRA